MSQRPKPASDKPKQISQASASKSNKRKSASSFWSIVSMPYQYAVSAKGNQNMIELIILASKIQKHGAEYPELLLFSLGHSQFLQMIHVSCPLKAEEQ